MADVTLNLVQDAWAPALSKGSIEHVTPIDLLKQEHRSLAYGKPDLNAAAVELLVCMAQTAIAPESRKEWKQWMRTGAFPHDLEERWSRLTPAFNVRDAKRPFLQDPSLDASKPKPIELLDATRSPANAVTEGRALFAQPDPDYRLSPDEAALRVWMYQSWSPISSSKLRGSYRGHGPLSTLVRMPTIRQTVLANLLPAPVPDTDPLAWLGWGGELSTKEDEPLLKHRDSNDPRSSLWMTPRRVLLAWDGDEAVGFVNGSIRGQLEQTAPHPHSPGRFEKEKWVAAQGRVLGRGYPALLPLMVESSGSKGPDRALTVKHFLQHRPDDMPGEGRGELWAYGYHVDNNVDGWNERVAPLAALGEDDRKRIELVLEVSEKILKSLWKACYEVVKDDAPERDLRPNDRKLPFDPLRDRYHRATEAAFWTLLEKPRSEAALAAWWDAACDQAQRLLDEWASSFPPTKIIGRVRGQAVLDGLRKRRATYLPLEDP